VKRVQIVVSGRGGAARGRRGRYVRHRGRSGEQRKDRI
jgi:hypothetical protein